MGCGNNRNKKSPESKSYETDEVRDNGYECINASRGETERTTTFAKNFEIPVVQGSFNVFSRCCIYSCISLTSISTYGHIALP
jgi:hypothetical protein